MNTQHLNRNLIDNINLFGFIQELTGQDMDLGLVGHLEALQTTLGLNWDQLDPIDTEVFSRAVDMIEAAFLAGYMVGRNPDLLILGDGGNIFRKAAAVEPWVVAEGND